MTGDFPLDHSLLGELSVPEGESQRVARLRSEDLFSQGREIEIEHRGRIYRLRLTSLNKLILTA